MLARGQQPVYASGECEIDLARRELRVLGSLVPVGGRAFEIVEILAQSAGELVTKSELMDRIWPGAIILENTLHVHTAAIRKALGPYRGLLKTESGRGYRLLGSWTVRQHPGAIPPSGSRPTPVSTQSAATNLPLPATGLVGRSAAVHRLRDLVSAYRVVTVTGPGGIGKTALALEVARGLLAEFDDGGWFVELAPLSDSGLVPAAVAGVLGLNLSGEEISAEALARVIGERKLLLVLDNCEHVIDAAARLAESLVRSCPGTTILATSREVFRIDGECAYRVPPLEVPALEPEESDHILRHSAVELFIARTKSLNSDFSSHAENLPTIAAICRHLDGIPLAIEFAAARTAALGIEEVAAGLRDRFALLTSGRRAAVPRHRTLRATLDWSYELLPEPERRSLRCLAVFAGEFTLEAVAAVAEGAELTDVPVAENIANLVAKSLVIFDASASPNRWRLLETIRAYAFQKLAESGEREMVAKRHAEHYRDLFERAEAEAETRPVDEWLAAYRPHIDNLRAALQWVFSPEGDVSIGVALAVAAIPLWIDMSMMAECRHHVERALALLNSGADRDPQDEMQLYAALGMSLNYTTGPVSATAAAWTRTLEIAKSLGNTEYQLRAFRGLWAHHMNAAEYRRALALAQEFRRLAAASTDPADLVFGDRMVALMLHYLGDQEGARRHLQHGRLRAAVRQSQTSRFLLDRDVTVQALLARILWLQGFPDEAARTARSAVDRALAIGHALSLCHALGQAACPVAHFIGDLAWAEDSAAILLDNARERGLSGWIARGRCFLGMAMISQQDFAGGVPLLRAALADLGNRGAAPGYPAFLSALAAGLGRAGQVMEGLAVIKQALRLAKGREEQWCVPELLRTEGELHLLEDRCETARPNAEDCFRQALEWAQRDDTPAWELRVTISLARLRVSQGRDDEARRVLAPVYERFKEGFGTSDLRIARTMLDALPT